MRSRTSRLVTFLTVIVIGPHCANGDQLSGGGRDDSGFGAYGGSDLVGTGGIVSSGGGPGTGGASTGGALTGTGGSATGGYGTGGFAGTGNAATAGADSGTPDASDGGLIDASIGDSSLSEDADAGATGGEGGSSGAGTGGALSTGGAPSTGGVGNTGGSAGTGGVPSTGGVANTGGAPSTGGVANTGGVPSTGGVASTGGVPSTGGVASTGGVPSTGGVANTGGSPGTGGVASTGGAGGSGMDAGSDGGPMPNTLPGFVNLAPPMLAPLDPQGGTPQNPAPPAGWTWYPIAGTQCRDGSQAGMYVHFTGSDKLYIYFEGGGACTNLGFCNFNPQNVNTVLTGTGETVLGTALGAAAGRQQPGVYEGGVLRGIFDTANAANPFQDWNGVYIPYCTGDVHFGTRANGTVPGVATPQQFVGYENTKKFIGHVVPTFKDTVNRVIVTGASAGSFAAGLNFSMIQDAFGDVVVDAILDSGMPFTDTYMPVCMQQRWRETWGLNAALPPDCTECFAANGGGMLGLADFLIRKHPNASLAAISSVNDEVMRLFFSMGLQNCANIDTADPVGITLGQFFPDVYYPAANYQAGLLEVKSTYAPTGRFATYILAGFNANLHQHTFRARFYDPFAGTITIAQFVDDFLNGNLQQIGP